MGMLHLLSICPAECKFVTPLSLILNYSHLAVTRHKTTISD